jgi:hypothetical protein
MRRHMVLTKQECLFHSVNSLVVTKSLANFIKSNLISSEASIYVLILSVASVVVELSSIW